MFQLQLSNTDVTSGTVALSWCLDLEAIKHLSDTKNTDPQVVICISPVEGYHSSKEIRKVVPLKDLMTFVEIRSSGKNKIWGFISYKSRKEALNYYSEKHGSFLNDILDWHGEEYASYIKNSRDISSPIIIDVPKELFADEPSDWEKNWVNEMFGSKAVDQCSFRKRRLFAYSIQPLIVGASLAVRLLITILAGLCLCRGFSFDLLLNPLAMSLRDSKDLFDEGTFAVKQREWKDESFPPPQWIFGTCWKIMLLPALWLPLILIWKFCNPIVAATLASFFVVVALVILGLAFFINYTKMVSKPINWISLLWERLTTPNDMWYMNKDEIDLITCNQDKKPLNYNTVPRKSIRLRFQNLKSKVCKPFSL